MGSRNSGDIPFRVEAITWNTIANGAGSAAALTSVKAHTHVFKAVCSAGQTIYVGRIADVATVTTSAKTWPMTNGETLVVESKDAADFCAFADAVGAKLVDLAGSFV